MKPVDLIGPWDPRGEEPEAGRVDTYTMHWGLMPEEPETDQEMRSVALWCAVMAADNAMRAVAKLWRLMGPEERRAWALEGSSGWPYADVMLNTIVRAAPRIWAEETRTRDRERG